MNKISVLDHGHVYEYKEKPSDLTPVNAARVSFHVKSEKLTDKDRNLIRYLYTHRHWTPFGHARFLYEVDSLKQTDPIYLAQFSSLPGVELSSDGNILYASLSLYHILQTGGMLLNSLHQEDFATSILVSKNENHNPLAWINQCIDLKPAAWHMAPELEPLTLVIKAPVFVRTQMFKHKYGIVENEVSRRYVRSEPEFYCPTVLREIPSNGIKQGSGADFVDEQINRVYDDAVLSTLGAYTYMLKKNVAPEMARSVLSQAMYTEWYWTGSLKAFARACRQRLDPHAQKETRDYAEAIKTIILGEQKIPRSIVFSDLLTR